MRHYRDPLSRTPYLTVWKRASNSRLRHLGMAHSKWFLIRVILTIQIIFRMHSRSDLSYQVRYSDHCKVHLAYTLCHDPPRGRADC